MGKMDKTNNRRNFLKTASALSASTFIIPASVLGMGKQASANDRINVGCIGVGPRGTDVMRHLLRNDKCRITALCDLKSNVLKEKQNLVNEFYDNKDCQTHHDFNQLVARKDIDACLVATCDHWHVLTSLAAVRSGKDVYMEKPMGLTLEEDQAMRDAVHKHKRIFQFGTQQRSDAKFRQACELVRNGKIGELKSINVWSPGSIQAGESTQVPVPEWVDYNFWLGPSKFTPYTKDRCSNSLWWFMSDYALGFIAGWGIHPIDIALWGAEDKFDGPWEIEGTGTFPTTGVCDTAMNWNVKIKLGSGIKINFTGTPCPPEWLKRYGEQESSHGTAFEGSEGWVYVQRGEIKASSPSILKAKVENPLYKSDNHAGNFLDCIRSRKEAISSIDAAVRGDTLCHISDIAIRREEKLVFDPKTERFIDNNEANKRLMRPMRAPWHL